MIALNKKIYSAIGFLIALAVIFTISIFLSPQVAKGKTDQALIALGIDPQFLPQPEQRWGAILYKDVSFDADSISTVKNLIVQYNPLWTLYTRRLHKLTLDQLSIIGEWEEDEAQPLSFSGWTPPEIARMLNAPVNQISIRNAQFSMLTPVMGGLTLNFDFAGSLNGRTMNFQSHFKSAQKFISFTAGANGSVTKDHTNIAFKIDQGKYESPSSHVRATRANGDLTLMKDKNESVRISGALKIGGLNLIDTPWQNATAKIEKKGRALELQTDAKSLGVTGLDLKLNYEQDAEPPVYGELRAANGQVLKQYLQSQSLKIPDQQLQELSRLSDIQIKLVYDKDMQKIQYKSNAPNASWNNFPLN